MIKTDTKNGRGIYVFIGARGGSKSIPKKNLLNIGGFPLIAYSIVAAKLTNGIERIIVSTDSEEIATVAKKFGAEVPFLRPSELASDNSPDREFIIHALAWLQKNEGKIPDYIVHLRPTSPLREPAKIDEAVEIMLKHPEATSLRSGHKIDTVPQKCFALENGFFVGLFPNDPRPDYHNLPRQAFPPTYKPDSYVDILKSSFVLKNPVIHGPKILAFLTPDIGDIDTQNDLKYVETILKNQKFQVYDYLKANYPNEDKINGNSKR
ncbi:MAG: N-acylneuraminate cytidylyltransferase [Parcubacteria group bacterium Gr01-1014_73]|nr:MAG: N-acylneuraminate cytidylyltransferase [Parcubacteria group bacterium Gr01-1014_73]